MSLKRIIVSSILLLGGVVLVRSGAAQVAPQTLTMQYIQATSIHLAGHEGAVNHRDKMNIRVELLAAGKLRAVDSGERSLHNLYSNFSTREETKWTNSWRGTYTTSEGTMELSLTLADRKCSKSKEMSGTKTEKLDCRAMSKQLRLTCRSEELAITEWSGPVDKPQHSVQKHPIWRCQAAESAGDVEFGDTPSRWLLGKSICVKIIGGRPGESYEKCSADER